MASLFSIFVSSLSLALFVSVGRTVAREFGADIIRSCSNSSRWPSRHPAALEAALEAARRRQPRPAWPCGRPSATHCCSSVTFLGGRWICSQPVPVPPIMNQRRSNAMRRHRDSRRWMPTIMTTTRPKESTPAASASASNDTLNRPMRTGKIKQ